jgi:hypothetical protein
MKKFQRNKEDFICEKCGFEVKGSGYTNHCPNCLWSKHVDINPGDRMESCGGMMEPVEFEFKEKKYSVWHKCLRCGAKRKNRISEGDNLDILRDLN